MRASCSPPARRCAASPTPTPTPTPTLTLTLTPTLTLTRCVGNGLEGVSVDYALPKGEVGVPHVPDDTTVLRMRYMHFGCNVVHEDLAFTQVSSK